MDRVKEPELMDTFEQAYAYADADFSSSEESLVNGLEKYLKIKKLDLDSKCLIIDMGCGPGNISERLSKRLPPVQIIGIDGSKEMLEIARKRRESLSDEIRKSSLSYKLASLKSILKTSDNYKLNADIVVSNSVLHHVHDSSDFWNGLKVLSSSSTVHYHRDLKRPDSLEQAIYFQETYLPDAPEVLKNDFLASLCAAFTVNEVRAQLDKLGLNSLKVTENEEYHLEIYGITSNL